MKNSYLSPISSLISLNSGETFIEEVLGLDYFLEVKPDSSRIVKSIPNFKSCSKDDTIKKIINSELDKKDLIFQVRYETSLYHGMSVAYLPGHLLGEISDKGASNVLNRKDHDLMIYQIYERSV